jgi:signal transduction histidine kinase/DNA-binding response OmpR family regulator
MKKYLSLLFLVLCYQSFAQDILLNSKTEIVNLCAKSSYYEDKTNKLHFEQVEKLNFQSFSDKQYNFHFSPSTFWVKFTLDSKLPADASYVIQVSNWYIDVADLYSRNAKGELKILKEGDAEVFSTKKIKSKYPCFSIDVKANSSQTYYLKIENSQYNNFTIDLIENLHYFKEFGDSRDFFSGIILMRFLFYLSFLFFMFHDTKFRIYSIFGVLMSFIYYFSGGYSSFIFQSSPYFANLAFYFTISFMPGVMSWYIYKIFEINNRLPKIKGLFIAFSFIGGINLLLNLFGHHAYLSHLFIAFMAFFVTFQLFFSIWLYINVHKPSIWYILLLFVYLPTFSAFYLRNAGVYEWANFSLLPLTFMLDSFSIPFITGALLRISKTETQKIEQSYFKKKLETEKLQELDTFKTNFFTNISHEFRTPLTLLVSPLADLAQKFPDEWVILVMQKNVVRLQNLINQFLELSKLDAGKLEVSIQKSDMVVFMKQILASFESLAQSKQIIFQHNQNLKEKDAYFDADKTESIIINLLSNAFKFTPINGRVLVDIVYQTDNVLITIQDFGIGISAQALPFIFDRFYQVNDEAHQNYEGTGIGLALVKELVGVLKGRISVKSEHEKGTEFEIILPINQETWKDKKIVNDTYELKLKPAFIIDNTPETDFVVENNEMPLLLIVEDNADLRHFIKNMFADKYQIVEANNGQKGLEKALELIPDMIITDLMMPILDGISLCKSLKEDVRTSHIPVIMLTAKVTNKDRIAGLELGADDYLTKPFEKNELIARVKNLIIQRENLRLKYSQLVIDTPQTQDIQPLSMDEQFLKKAKEVIEKNMSDNNFDLEQFCEAMNMSRTTMHRKLKAVTNQTTTEFIRNLRLQKASILLKQKVGTVSEIAYQVGFSNLPYFSKTFQEHFGVSPSEYR